jgi:hypothetical protein
MKISPALEFDPWTVQPVASRYTVYAILASSPYKYDQIEKDKNGEGHLTQMKMINAFKILVGNLERNISMTTFRRKVEEIEAT